MDAASLEQSLPFRPWFTIWFHPCQTIQQIVDRNPWYGIYLLIPLSALGSGLGNWLTAVGSDTDTFQENILLAVGYSLLVSIYSAFLCSLIMQWWTGRSGQKIPYSHLVSAIYWGAVPYIGYLLVFLLIVAGTAFLSLIIPSAGSIFGIWIDLLAMLLSFLFAVWSFVLTLGTLSQVMDCSTGTAFARWLGAGLLTVMPFWVLYILIV